MKAFSKLLFQFLLNPIVILLLALAGAPLFVVFGGAALTAFERTGGSSQTIIIEIARLLDAPVLAAIPMFTFAGYLMAESQTPRRLVNLSRALFGWIPGGLAIVSIVACAFFTAFTGASGVTIIALGGLIYPILVEEKYGEKFSTGLMTTCGSLGLLFPPSLPIILYSIVASNNNSNVPINQLFMAGIFPGILLMVILMGYAVYRGITVKSTRTPFQWDHVGKALKEAAFEIPLPIIILVGIYRGIFTAGEAPAITAFYVFVIEVFVYRDLSLTKDIPRIAKDSIILVGSILIILAVAMGFTAFLIDQQIPHKIFVWIESYIHSKMMFLIALNIFLLIVGCLMDIFSAIIVVVPLIIPIAEKFGVNPIHLGIIFLTNLEIGYITPPVGINLFISSIRFKKSILYLYRASFPFLVLLLIALLIITYWPGLSLYLIERLGVS